jgi:hypothetical protein
MTSREQWLEIRRRSIGASDAVVLLRGPQFDTTAQAILDSKLGAVSEKTNDDIRRGQLYEPIVLAEFARLESERLGIAELRHAGTVDPMSLYYVSRYTHASLDGLALLADGTHLLLEVKCPRGKKASDAKNLGATQEWKIQSRYQQAVYSLVTGTPRHLVRGLVVVWHSEEAAYHTHDTSMLLTEEYEEAAGWLEYCNNWYASHVICGQPLEPVAPPVAIEAFETSHLCDGNEAMICQWYQRACQAVKEAETDKQAAALALADMASGLKARRLIADGVTITRVVQPGRKSVSLEKVRADHPEINWEAYERVGGDFITWRVGK